MPENVADEDWSSITIGYLKKRFEGMPPALVANEVIPFILKVQRDIVYPTMSLTEKIKSTKWFDLENKIRSDNEIKKCIENLEEFKVGAKEELEKSIHGEVLLSQFDASIEHLKKQVL